MYHASTHTPCESCQGQFICHVCVVSSDNFYLTEFKLLSSSKALSTEANFIETNPLKQCLQLVEENLFVYWLHSQILFPKLNTVCPRKKSALTPHTKNNFPF